MDVTAYLSFKYHNLNGHMDSKEIFYDQVTIKELQAGIFKMSKFWT